jgi:hypothetical protein
MKKKITFTIITIISISVNFCFAQPEFDDHVEDTPIDSGIVFLVLSLFILGTKMLDKRAKLEVIEKKTDKVLNFFAVRMRRIMFAGFFKRKEI